MVSKKLQSKSMCIDSTMKQLKSMLSYFENYRNAGFTKLWILLIIAALELNVEPIFPTKASRD